MDRLKQLMVSNTETLHQEMQEITLRLENIVQQYKELSEEIQSLSYDNFISNKDFYLSLTTKQYEMIQNLIVVNLQLEEYQHSNKLITKNSPKTEKCPISKIVNISRKETKKTLVSTTAINDNTTSSEYSNPDAANNNKQEIETNSSSDEVVIDKTDQQPPVENHHDKCVTNKLQYYGLLREQKKYGNILTPSKIPNFKFTKSNTVKFQHNNKVHSTSKMGEKRENLYFEGNLKPPLAPYKDMNCTISHVISPSEFYINHTSENMDEIERISSDYSTHHDSPEDYFLSKSEAKANIRAYCLCYTDQWQFWYRARVIDWLDFDTSTENVKVFLVDYGYALDVTFKNLRPLLKKYADPPECAIKCHLAYLHPLGSTEENQVIDWPQDAITAFKDITGPENQSIFKVVYVDRFNHSWGIDLAKITLKEDSTVGQQLLDKNQCVEIMDLSESSPSDEGFIQSQLETAQGFEGISSKMTDNEKLETFCKNLDIREPGNLDEALSGYKANDQARTCQQFLRHGYCYKLPNCRFDHEPLRKDGYTTDKVEVFIDTTTSIQLPDEGETFQVRITSIFGLTRWYGNLTSKMTTFNQLSEQLNNPKFIQKYKMFNILPSIGELVIIKIDTGAEAKVCKWYRGQVLDVYRNESSPKDIVEVFLVDTGEIIDTNVINIRIMIKELIYVPFQAVLLKLHGIKEKEDMCNNEVIEYCRTNYVGKNLNGTVLHKSSAGLLVKMNITSRRQRNLDISELIIADGYGISSDDDLLPKRGNSLKYELSLD